MSIRLRGALYAIVLAARKTTRSAVPPESFPPFSQAFTLSVGLFLGCSTKVVGSKTVENVDAKSPLLPTPFFIFYFGNILWFFCAQPDFFAKLAETQVNFLEYPTAES